MNGAGKRRPGRSRKIDYNPTQGYTIGFTKRLKALLQFRMQYLEQLMRELQRDCDLSNTCEDGSHI